MADLFTLEDLAAFLREDFPPDDPALPNGPSKAAASAQRARRVAHGQLRAATGLREWPAPAPDDLWAWGVELAALAWDNPRGRATSTTGAVSDAWIVTRRREILAEAARRYGPSGSGAPGPAGLFPLPVAWPDPPLTGVAPYG